MMPNRLLNLLVVIIVLCSIHCTSQNYPGQNIYYITASNDIVRLNADSTFTTIIHVNLQPPLFDIYDIALSPSNKFYAISGDHIIEINNDGSYSIVLDLPFETHANALTCNSNYDLFTIDNLTYDLYKYNIITHTLEIVTNLGFGTPGDITFYKGNIIIPASFTNLINAYNLENNSIVNIFCIPENVVLWGIAGIYESCDNTILLGCSDSNIYQLNFENFSAVNLGGNPQGFLGMCSESEYLSSNCSYQFSDINCNLSLPDQLLESKIVVSPNPVKDFLNLKTNSIIKKVEIIDTTGKIIITKFNNSEIEMSSLSSGLYFVKVTFDNTVLISKVIKE